MTNIRLATAADWPSIWIIFQQVIKSGESFSFGPDTAEDYARLQWQTDPVRGYVAEDEQGTIVGTFFLRPNQPGLGNHVANAGYMVAEQAKGQGIGRAMGEYSIVEAKRLGYEAMQFNFVVSTNTAAVNLWEKLGFKIVGTVPQAFRHAHKGKVAVYVMYREL